MKTIVASERTDLVFREWSERIERFLPLAAVAVEDYAGLPLNAPLNVQLVTARSYRAKTRKWLQSVLTTVGTGRHGAGLVSSPMSWLLLLSAGAEHRVDTLYVVPARHRALFAVRPPEWYWEYVLVHELTHHAQRIAQQWSDQQAIEDTWQQVHKSDGRALDGWQEGHADWVALRWLADHHPGCNPEQVLEPRRRLKLLLTVLKGPLQAVLGSKAAGYMAGRTFTQALFDHGGLPFVNRIWSDLRLVPTQSELINPTEWFDRTTYRAAADEQPPDEVS